MDFYLRPIIEHHFMCKFWIYVLGTEVSVTISHPRPQVRRCLPTSVLPFRPLGYCVVIETMLLTKAYPTTSVTFMCDARRTENDFL